LSTSVVFFYGLFMDADLLRERGVSPTVLGPASVADMTLRIGNRAALVAQAGARAHGIVMNVPTDDLDALYADDSLKLYVPQHVRAEFYDGSPIDALCYNLPAAPAPDERNPDYAARLRVVAARAGLPEDYVASIG
jgi:hypothetical protein